MAKHKTVRTWIELSETFLNTGKYPEEVTLFVNRCEVREKPSGGRYLLRSSSCEFIRVTDADDEARKVAAYAMREDVRRLVKGLDANDADALPRRVDDPPQDVLDGTADVYAIEEESPT
jgi:hypothetical protein